jgi:hypothetical protein
MKEQAQAVAAAINAAGSPLASLPAPAPTQVPGTTPTTAPGEPATTATPTSPGMKEKSEADIAEWRRKRALAAALLNKDDSEGCISCGS